jgi:glycosyltransferase involved in cell wall biosynthesis
MPEESVSVVMPVRNVAPYVDDSIASILDQTYQNFELVIYDDASDDDTYERVQRWAEKDARIRVLAGGTLLGLAGSSNLVTHEAKGSLIARMDGDDIAHPQRIEKQLRVLSRPSVVLVGTAADGIDGAGAKIRSPDRWRLLNAIPFAPFPHGSVMFRKAAFKQVGGYREECSGWEDNDLFLRLIRLGEIAVLTAPLYSYRYHTSNSVSELSIDYRRRVLWVQRHCHDRHLVGQPYDDLLETSPPAFDRRDAAALEYTTRSAQEIWSGFPPTGVLRLPTFRSRTAGSWVRNLVYGTWGRKSPLTLRAALRLFIAARDRLARHLLRDREEVTWRSRPS